MTDLLRYRELLSVVFLRFFFLEVWLEPSIGVGLNADCYRKGGNLKHSQAIFAVKLLWIGATLTIGGNE